MKGGREGEGREGGKVKGGREGRREGDQGKEETDRRMVKEYSRKNG